MALPGLQPGGAGKARRKPKGEEKGQGSLARVGLDMREMVGSKARPGLFEARGRMRRAAGRGRSKALENGGKRKNPQAGRQLGNIG